MQGLGQKEGFVQSRLGVKHTLRLWFSPSPTVSENATHGLFVLGSSFVFLFGFSETAFGFNLDYDSVRNEKWGLVSCGTLQGKVHSGSLQEFQQNKRRAPAGGTEVP